MNWEPQVLVFASHRILLLGKIIYKLLFLRHDRKKHRRRQMKCSIGAEAGSNVEKILCKLILSRWKPLSLKLRPEELIVRAPLRATNGQIEYFVEQHRRWIRQHQEKLEWQAAEFSVLTETELKSLTEQAQQYIPERVRYYAPRVGVDYGHITIRSQKSRWGRCSSKGNLSFNCLLMLAPPEVIDSVVVHELCHRKEMNHSAAFYAHVLRVFPEYRIWNKWLKENGHTLMLRKARACTL